MSGLTATDSRSLEDLHPTVRSMAVQLLAKADVAGLPLEVTFTLRSLTCQAALYAQGRTMPGPIVTNAPAGFSYHNYGLALDVVPLALLALPDWGDTPAHQAATNVTWVRLAMIGKGLGFRWGGDFLHLKDRPHFEWSGGLSLAQLRDGRLPSTPAKEGDA